MRNFKEYIVWQKAMDLSISIYAVTKDFPADERFGLTSQVRRASVSIPSNIAEGAGTSTPKHFGEYLQRALGSSFELETQLILSNKLKYVPDATAIKIIDQIIEIQKMVSSLIKKVKE